MKRILLAFILIPFISFSQVQIGNDIDGENPLDWFGYSISLSADGSILAVASPGYDANGQGSGSARVFQNIDNNWVQIGQDVYGDGSFDSGSNSAVCISPDGTTLALGSPAFDGGHGQVKVYRRQGDNWIKIGDDIVGDDINLTGRKISFSFDGSIIAITDYGISTRGRVKIFQNVNDNWVQIGSDITGEAIDGHDNGVTGLSLSYDGFIVALGTPYSDRNETNAGLVRVYQNINGDWVQLGSDILGENQHDWFGISVSLSSDGLTLGIGVGTGNGNNENSGNVRVFQYEAGSDWVQKGNTIGGENTGDLFGHTVGISSDGSIIAIGSPANDGNGEDSGHVGVYRYVAEDWVQVGIDIDGDASHDRSGSSIGLSSSGSILAVGAPFNDGADTNGVGTNIGHVKVYSLSSVLSTDNSIETQFSIYPNPAKDHLNIKLKNSIDFKKVRIFSPVGVEVLRTNSTSVNVSHLTSGLYIIEVETTTGKETRKLIKN